VNAAQHFAVVMMIPATLWVLLGGAVMKRLVFPMAYLLFAVPFGEFLVPSLQDITATIAVKTLQFTGIPVLWEGRYFFIPSGNFEVAEACSGVRYLIASLALGTLYAYISYHSWWRRVVFIALSAAVPVLANGVRAYGIVMIAHLSDYQLAIGVDHFIYGWVFFSAVMLLLFWLGNYFRDAPVVRSADGITTNIDAVPVSKTRWAWGGLALAIILFGPVLDSMVQRASAMAPAFDLRLPPGLGAWHGPQATRDLWLPKFDGATTQQRVEYRGDRYNVQVYVAYYAQQREGAELINSENALFDRSSERRVSEDVQTVVLADGTPWTLRALRVRSAHGERLVWSWYVVAGQATASPVLAKLYEVRARVLGGQNGAALVALATDDTDDLQGASTRLKEFLDRLRRPLNASVGGN
jgi:EpsI family protein